MLAACTAATLRSGGVERTYVLHRPRAQAGPRPAVIVLHGAFGSGAQTERYTGFDRVADARGWVAVYPDGIGRRWNDGGTASQPDDIGYLRDLIGALAADGIADPRHVYLAGISNGGFLAARAACELGDRLDGVATVIATIAAEAARTCRPVRTVPVLIIAGTADPLVPYAGGMVAGGRFSDRGTALGAEAALAHWAALAHCRPGGAATALPVRDGTDSTRITRIEGCADSGVATLLRVEGGGHAWPGAAPYLPRTVGPTSRQIDASATIAEFFEQAARRAP